jgi:putative transposase
LKKKRFAEGQIIAVLKEHEAGMKTGDVACKHGISDATLYNWKAKFGGMGVSDAKRLRALEEENGKLVELDTVLQSRSRKIDGRRVDGGLQHHTATFIAGLSDASGLRRKIRRSGLSCYAPPGLRMPACCTTRPTEHTTAGDSNSCGMKLQWQVKRCPSLARTTE